MAQAGWGWAGGAARWARKVERREHPSPGTPESSSEDTRLSRAVRLRGGPGGRVARAGAGAKALGPPWLASGVTALLRGLLDAQLWTGDRSPCLSFLRCHGKRAGGSAAASHTPRLLGELSDVSRAASRACSVSEVNAWEPSLGETRWRNNSANANLHWQAQACVPRRRRPSDWRRKGGLSAPAQTPAASGRRAAVRRFEQGGGSRAEGPLTR